MLTIPGYKIDNLIYKSASSSIFKGKREPDSAAVIVKIPTSKYLSLDDAEKFKRDYQIGSQLNDANIIQYYFHVGDRSKESAKQLWHKIPETYRKQAVFHTDLYESYVDIIPQTQHLRVTKQTGLTNHIERFNCTCGREFHGWSGILWPSQKSWLIISAPFTILSATITKLENQQHYMCSTTEILNDGFWPT